MRARRAQAYSRCSKQCKINCYQKQICTIPDPLGPSTTPKPHKFIIDTGCTGHFLAVNAPYTNKQSTMKGISVRLPNQDTMTATHTADLNLPNLPRTACTAHINPALGTTSLISVGQLCDAQCIATFTNNKVTITHNNNTILTGKQTKSSNLWQATIPHIAEKTAQQNNMEQQQEPSANNVNQTQKTAELVAFAHSTLYLPAISTLQQALAKNYIHNFPGLTAKTL